MENSNYVNLAGMNEVFDNKTFRYRINGFAYACGIKDISIVKNAGTLFDTEGFNNLNVIKSDNAGYLIAVNKNEYPTGKTVTLTGQYEDLNFTFTNYRVLNKDISKIDRKILELPFSISLFKNIDKDTYHLEIETVNDMETKFTITKSRDHKNKILSSRVSFYANVLDFSKVLKLVKSFVYNPILAFNTYIEVINNKKITITNSDLNKGIMQDECLDKPMGKIKKLVRRITNNDNVK